MRILPVSLKSQAGANIGCYEKNVRFGLASHREILAMAPAVELTTSQNQVLGIIDEMVKARDVHNLEKYLSILNMPDYGHLQYIMHRGDRQTIRERFHSPFTDLMLSLTHDPLAQHRVIQGIADVIRKPPTPVAVTNAIEALADVYFYLFRPGGEALVPGNKGNEGYAIFHQQTLAGLFRDLLTDGKLPVKTRRLLKNELLCGQYDIIRKDWPVVKPKPDKDGKVDMVGHESILINMNHQLNGLAYMQLPDYLITPVPAETAKSLREAIRDGRIRDIMKLMKNDAVLKALIPDWGRAFGKHRFQHADQDYSLGVHLLKVYRQTRASRYYKLLSPEEQFRASTAALLHDIAKRSGPKNLRDARRIMFDVHHPWRSGEVALEVLPSLGYTPEQVADIVTVIQRHQNIGNLTRPGIFITEDRIQEIAKRLGSVSRVNMLLALTEGDVSCVKRPGKDNWLTDRVIEVLNHYAGRIRQFLAQMQELQALTAKNA